MNPARGNGKSALLLSGGTVIDGTGADRFVADVRIDGDRITAIGPGLVAADAEVIDAAGLIVAPGFIDVHTHDDQIVLADPRMLPKITQGVTTVIVGNCGISLAPLVHADVPPPLNLLGGNDKYVFPTMAAYVAAVGRAQPAVNVAALVGHSTLRVATMDDPYRAATSAEQARMVELLREGMDAGAIGLSSGVFYATGAAADVDELALLAGVAGAAGGIYTTHIRNEMNDIFAALDEAFTAARRGHVPVVISHHKCAGPQNWGRTVQTLAHIDAARAQQPIGLDAYPYVAGSTVLRADLVDGIIDVVVTSSVPHPEMAARHLADIAAEWNCTQQEACERLQPGGACYFQMREDDVQRVLRYPATMIGSDGLPHDQSSASTPVGNVSPRARPLQPRSRTLPARDRRAQDDRAERASIQPAAARRAARRLVCGCVRVRSGNRARRRHVRAASGDLPRHRPCAGQRRDHPSARARGRGSRGAIPAVRVRLMPEMPRSAGGLRACATHADGLRLEQCSCRGARHPWRTTARPAGKAKLHRTPYADFRTRTSAHGAESTRVLPQTRERRGNAY